MIGFQHAQGEPFEAARIMRSSLVSKDIFVVDQVKARSSQSTFDDNVDVCLLPHTETSDLLMR